MSPSDLFSTATPGSGYPQIFDFGVSETCGSAILECMPNETPAQRISRIGGLLSYRHRLIEEGVSDQTIQQLIASNKLIRVVPGAYMRSDSWGRLFPEEKLLARTVAVGRLHRGAGVVFSHYSAAVIWGLPLWGHQGETVHLLTPRDSPSNASHWVYRHHHAWQESDTEVVAGLVVTNLSNTIVDIARVAKPELAVGVADAGVRAMFQRGRGSVDPRVEEWRGSQLELLANLRGGRGVRSATKVLEFADPRSDSVAESVSRLQFARLQMEVEIQVPVRGTGGDQYWLDFKFVGQGVFGEVDGQMKYADKELLGGQTPAQRVISEKRREDDVRGVTGDRIVRWMPDAIGTAERLGRRMLAFGLQVPAMQ